MDEARALLRWHAANPLAAARTAHQAGVPVVGITAPTVPAEIVIAAGAFPVVLRRPPGPTPHADRDLEDGIFAPRLRGIYEGLLSGEWSFLSAVIVPRTSEQEYKLFLYLHEMARGGSTALPPAHLYDLLHARSTAAPEYVRGRTRALVETLERLAGRGVSNDDLASAITERNGARRAAARLWALRADRPRLGGREALALLAASVSLAPGEYARLAGAAAAALDDQPPIDGPRIVIAGTPDASAALTETVESLGAVVVWEETYAARIDCERPIDDTPEPVSAIAAHYYGHVASPRVFPPELADAPFAAAARAADAVIFYYPPEDYVAGWDYPRRRALAESVGLPHLRIRRDVATGATPDDEVAAWLAVVRARGRVTP